MSLFLRHLARRRSTVARSGWLLSRFGEQQCQKQPSSVCGSTGVAQHSNSESLSRSLQQWRLYAKAGKKQQAAADATADPGEFDPSEMQGLMHKAVEHLKASLGTVRTGRASPGMLDLIKVEVYGEKLPMKGVASISVQDSQMLSVSVFDPSTIGVVEKAIRDSPLQLNPRIEKQDILVPIPRPTKESLDAMAKMVRKEGEAARVSIRQARKAAMDIVKKTGSEDSRKRVEKQVQKVTDEAIKEVDSMCAAKEEALKAAV